MNSQKEVLRQRLEEKLERECGEVMTGALRDPSVIEILLNPDGKLWIDVAGKGMEFTGHRVTPGAAESVLTTCASMLQTTITRDNLTLKREFPLEDYRARGIIGSSRRKSPAAPMQVQPTIEIRKDYRLNVMVNKDIFSPVATRPSLKDCAMDFPTLPPLPELPAVDEWFHNTRVGLFSRRSATLQELDRALVTYQQRRRAYIQRCQAYYQYSDKDELGHVGSEFTQATAATKRSQELRLLSVYPTSTIAIVALIPISSAALVPPRSARTRPRGRCCRRDRFGSAESRIVTDQPLRRSNT